MKPTETVTTIQALAGDPDLSFQDRVERISHRLALAGEGDILAHLDYAGIIPECFRHDSTEEKLFAKYCDALLARSLAALGMTAAVITERSGCADVVAAVDGYRLVADAKAFRLSRTAKNQKDFKVDALNGWRKGADFAVLCAPLYQYPTSSSQIYEQATRVNVTLLSYTHLAYLIRNKPQQPSSLRGLWELGKVIGGSKNAAAYWDLVSRTLCEITGTTRDRWDQAERALRAGLPGQAEEQVSFWEREKGRVAGLSRAEAIRELTRAMKIDGRIATIRRTARS